MSGEISNTQRIALNTSAQYIRTIINTLLSFYSTRLILAALGVVDFGIYSLVSSVVLLLSFVTNALTTTTQRYLNFYQGQNNPIKNQHIFHNSFILHLILGLCVVVIIEVIGLFLFDGALNIPLDRIGAGKVVYHCVATMILITFIAAPFRALLISHENIVYTSVIDVIDGVLRVIIAILLTNIEYDKLISYGTLMVCVPAFNFLAFSIFCVRQYNECKGFSFRNFEWIVIKELASFATWIVYSTGCVVARTQGIAIVFNKFVGAVANAAFGVASQVSSAITFISSALVTAVNPQLMKAEGVADRKKMLRYAEVSSKFAFLLLAMLVVPCVFEMPRLLCLWLGQVPEYAVMMCRMLMIAALLDQLTTGLGSANQATGKVRNYSLIVNTTKVLTLPVAYICIKLTHSLFGVMVCYVAFELLCALMRLPYLHVTAGLSIRGFIKKVFLKVVVPFVVLVCLCSLVWHCFEPSIWRMVLIFTIPNMLYVIVIYSVGLCKDEKIIVSNYMQILKKRLCKR